MKASTDWPVKNVCSRVVEPRGETADRQKPTQPKISMNHIDRKATALVKKVGDVARAGVAMKYHTKATGTTIEKNCARHKRGSHEDSGRIVDM